MSLVDWQLHLKNGDKLLFVTENDRKIITFKSYRNSNMCADGTILRQKGRSIFVKCYNDTSVYFNLDFCTPVATLRKEKLKRILNEKE